jgi:hypothetical protein
MLGLTDWQVRRLHRAYERDGPKGVASKHRGRPSDRRLASDLRRDALATVRSRYEGFGSALAHEKRTELHGLRLSVTLELIQERQRERIEAKLAKPSTSLRKARLLRAGTPRRTSSGSPAEAGP